MKRSLIGTIVALTAIVIVFLILYKTETPAKLTTIQPVQDGKILITVQLNVDADQLVVSIQNNGSTTITFDANFEVQVKRGNGWVKYFEPKAIPAIGCELEPGKITTKNIASASSINLKTGDTYRIVKDIEGMYYASDEFIA